MALVCSLLLFEYLYLSGMWFGLAPRTDTEKAFVNKEIGVCAPNMIIILGLISTQGGGLYDHIVSMRIFTLIVNKMFIGTHKIMRKVATTLI